jgi:hypothetical protein
VRFGQVVVVMRLGQVLMEMLVEWVMPEGRRKCKRQRGLMWEAYSYRRLGPLEGTLVRVRIC